MLKIRKDNNEMSVTSGAFENLYKGMGYEIVEETKKATTEEVVAPQPTIDKTEDKEPTEQKETKPTFDKKGRK